MSETKFIINKQPTPEEFTNDLIDFNQKAVLTLLPGWCSNIADNLEIAREITNLPDPAYKGHDSCVVVAGAPELTNEEIVKLKHADVDIIITNKNLERFIGLGVYPTYVCLLDANPISRPQFKILGSMKHPEKLRFFVAMTSFPGTLKIIFEKSVVYGFNPEVFTGGLVALSKTWEWMNDKEEMSHGGNVGCLAFDLAKKVGYKRIGLLGFGFCEIVPKEIVPTLTPDTVFEGWPTEFIGYEDTGDTVALPIHFKAYLMYLLNSVQEVKEGVMVANLTKSPLLTHSPVLTQMSLDEFLKVN
jgi:hypothetical protein